MVNLMDTAFQRIYLLTDDDDSVRDLSSRFDHSNITLVTFPEQECVQSLTNAQCFAISVFLMTKGVCKRFFGSSTSNIARMVMLLGDTYVDFDGVVDYFTSIAYGRWYRPPDHCYIVDGRLQSGEVCGYIHPRCQFCVENTCSEMPTCLSPNRARAERRNPLFSPRDRKKGATQKEYTSAFYAFAADTPAISRRKRR